MGVALNELVAELLEPDELKQLVAAPDEDVLFEVIDSPDEAEKLPSG